MNDKDLAVYNAFFEGSEGERRELEIKDISIRIIEDDLFSFEGMDDEWAETIREATSWEKENIYPWEKDPKYTAVSKHPDSSFTIMADLIYKDPKTGEKEATPYFMVIFCKKNKLSFEYIST